MYSILIATIGILDSASSVLLRIWSENNRPLFLAGGVLGFALTGLLFGYSIKLRGLAITNILWIGISTIALTIIAYFFFNEKISLIQVAAMCLIIVGTILLSQ